MGKDIIELCEKYATERGFDFLSINKIGEEYRVNFKEYDGDGYIIHKILLKDLLTQ